MTGLRRRAAAIPVAACCHVILLLRGADTAQAAVPPALVPLASTADLPVHPRRWFVPIGSETLSVYLPPGYGDDPARRYPVLAWCGGVGSTVKPFDFADGTAYARSSAKYDTYMVIEELIAAGRIPPVIVVSRDSSETDWKPHIAWVDANLASIPGRTGHALIGFSGGCESQVRNAFRACDAFSAMIGISHPIFYGVYQNNGADTKRVIDANLARFRAQPVELIMSFGSQEGSQPPGLVDFRERMSQAYGIAASVREVPGIGHDEIAHLRLAGDALIGAALLAMDRVAGRAPPPPPEPQAPPLVGTLRYVFAPPGTAVPPGSVLCPGSAWGPDATGRLSGFSRDLAHCALVAAPSSCIAYPRGPMTLAKTWSFDPFAGVSQPVGTVLPTAPMLDWSVALPDGHYRVEVGFGHPTSLHHPEGSTTPRHHHLVIGGQAIADEAQSSLDEQVRSLQVQVAGGRLRMISGGRANGPALRWIAITAVAAGNAKPAIVDPARGMPGGLILP